MDSFIITNEVSKSYGIFLQYSSLKHTKKNIK